MHGRGGAIDPQVIVLFGATGDLSRRKILPALMHLSRAGLMPAHRIVGSSLEAIGDEAFRSLAIRAGQEFSRHGTTACQREDFAARLSYVPSGAGPAALAEAVAEAERTLPSGARRLLYLSVPPDAAQQVLGRLGEAGLTRRARVVMEKPFGTDAPSARRLNATLHRSLGERQIFRIDHFLGKEAAQNILAFRFANGLFEPIWNRNHVDHVQIDVPETLDVGARAAFYEATGAYRDMVVTHLMQVLAFVAMEPPTALGPEAITEEKNKVFRSLRPIGPGHLVRGQYAGYRAEAGVAPASTTETFVALRCEVDNWRWSGVPFYLRTGKRMAEAGRIVSIAFRQPPGAMFPAGSGLGGEGPDHLTFDLDEASRLSLSFYGKRPGQGMRLGKASLQFSLEDAGLGGDALEGYERLLLDAMAGDHTLFTTAGGIERLWEISAPLLSAPPEILPYPQGSWGPAAAHELIAPRRWRLPFERAWRLPHAAGL
jgi:glucose-6-phosphate 1-dehydrogenase